ncbi:MAG: RluA family pseudouridine synthase [Anaerolineae bacterium]|jgi:23S rRNA pseudouridine1911/1915/1917 synthase
MRERSVTFGVGDETGARGSRLDKVVRDRVADLSRAQAQRLIEAGDVTVNGEPQKAAYRVRSEDRIAVVLPPEEPQPSVRPEPIPLEIVYEDEHLLVVDKPAGMVVHPAPGHPSGTLVNALLAHSPPIAEVGRRDRVGIVHRLDKETSGVLVVGKEEVALRALQEQFRNRQVKKTYLALARGTVEPSEGIIEVPIGRHPADRQRMTALPDGKYARTRYHTLERLRKHTLLELHPHTGRTHQVRVHLAWLGYPVVGDQVYGPRCQRLLQTRHFLHAYRLGLTHPASGEEMTFEAPLPPVLDDLLARLRRPPARTPL